MRTALDPSSGLCRVMDVSLVGLLSVCLWGLGPAVQATLGEQLPEGQRGIAADFPGDAGIEQHPDVIFAENFEQPALETMWKRWEHVAARESMSFSDDTPPGSSGRQSLVMERQEGSGAALYRRLANQAGGWGHDRVFFRFYVKFAPDCGELHHGVSALGGSRPASPYPMVSAGNRPDGTRSFWSGIEPYGAAWTWDYYCYWSEMRGSPPAGRTWGNSLIRDSSLEVEKDSWICIEHMIQVNDPGDTNGEQALWIDGKLVSHLGKGFSSGVWIWDKFHPGRGGQGVRWGADGREDFQVPAGGAPFEGFRWRTVEELNVNYIWLYIYTERPPGHRIQVSFDDVVVARNYIGPIRQP